MGIPLALWAAIGALRAGRDPAMAWVAIGLIAAAAALFFV